MTDSSLSFFHQYHQYLCATNAYGLCAATLMYNYPYNIMKAYEIMNNAIDIDPFFVFPSTPVQPAGVTHIPFVEAVPILNQFDQNDTYCISVERPDSVNTTMKNLFFTEDDLDILNIDDTSKSFNQSSEFAAAQEYDSNDSKRYQCRECGKRYKSTDGVKKHWRKKHAHIYVRKGHTEDYCVRK